MQKWIKWGLVNKWRRKEVSNKGVPFVVTYNLILKSLGKVIQDNFYLFYMNIEVKKTFTRRPMILFKTDSKTSSHLVTAKLYSPDIKLGSNKCGKEWCEIYHNISNSGTFISIVTRKTYEINQQFDCDSTCLIYLLTCKSAKSNTLERQITLN